MVTLITLALTGCVSLWSTADDWDGDGFTIAQGDCSDVDADIHPDAVETWYDGIDQNCDDNDGDQDGDGWVPQGYADEVGDWEAFAAHVAVGDCWDDPTSIPTGFRVVPGQGWEQPDASTVYPGADDTWYDAVDADCAQDDDFDHDLDTYRSAFHVDAEGALGDDCLDDSDRDASNPAGIAPADANPGAQETWYDGTDQDCSDPDAWDGSEDVWSDYDADGDGYPAGAEGAWDDVDEDCDDTDATRFPNPDLAEVWYDCFDQDCDGNDGDQDGDGVLAEGYEETCADTWDAPEYFLHGETGDCQDDPDGVPDPQNGNEPIAAEDIYPDGAEVWYDGLDSDCAGDSDFDMDQDGYDAADQDTGAGETGDDCDDMDAAVNPGQVEDCNTPADDDCTGTANDPGAVDCVDFYADEDEDGYGGPLTECLCEALPPYEFPDDSDCNDDDPGAHPGATEYCDATDWDCDGVVDESSSADATSWNADSDGDGFGDPLSTTVSCAQPTDHLVDDQDCDDTDPAVNPDATELCNTIDDDCDTAIDEAGSLDGTAYYVDADGDGYGDLDDLGNTYCSDPGSGYSASADDCDDTEAAVSPAATEVCDDADTDEDCSGAADDDDPGATGTSLLYDDLDSDGYGDVDDPGTEWCDPPATTSASNDDCDDGATTTYPGAVDDWYDGVDADCAGDDDYDADLDGFQRDDDGGDDCDDADPAINTAATEVCDPDLVDEDCDGLADDDDDSVTGTTTWYADRDGDGAGLPADSVSACLQPSDYVDVGGDCNDGDATAFVGAPEVCDAVDNDCDTTVDEGQSDVDSDGLCDGLDAEDCDGVDNDGDTAVDEGLSDSDADGLCDGLDAEECDDLDNDGDGLIDDDDPGLDKSTATSWFQDSDGDGYGDSGDLPDRLCDAPSATVDDATDCDDTDIDVNPGATEVCDSVDNDCDGDVDDDDTTVDLTGALTYYADLDSDGYGDEDDPGTAWCTAPAFTSTNAVDCDDNNSANNPAGTEICDSDDNDCDGSVDEGQTDTDADGTCDAVDFEECDGQDNDGDGDIDEPSAVDATIWYDDADGDGFGDPDFSTLACNAPSLTVSDGTDCDDTRDDVYPGAEETCDSADNDCDSTVDEDATDAIAWYLDLDSDGYGDPDVSQDDCTQPSGYEADSTDCDDGDATRYPGAAELDDLIDQDCDDAVDEDFVAEGDLVITEVMAVPSGIEPDEEWFEVVNTSGADLALDGLYVLADCGDFFAVSPEGWVLADGDAFVFCHDDTLLGSDCDYVYGSDVNSPSSQYETSAEDLCLGDTGGELALSSAGGVFPDLVAWSPGDGSWPVQSVGASWVLDPAAVDHLLNDDGLNWCYPLSSDVFGSGDFGTPGAVGTCQASAP